MTTPLIVLTILFVPTLIAAVIAHRTATHGIINLGGVLGYAAAFAFFAVGHFVITDEMVSMLPDFLPARRPLVYATGLLEAELALALLVGTVQSHGVRMEKTDKLDLQRSLLWRRTCIGALLWKSLTR